MPKILRNIPNMTLSVVVNGDDGTTGVGVGVLLLRLVESCIESIHNLRRLRDALLFADRTTDMVVMTDDSI